MSRFTGQLTITQLDVDCLTWQLEEVLVYEVGAEGSGRVIAVYHHFRTDGASIPRWAQSLLPKWGRYSRAAILHDYLYNQIRNAEPHPEAPDRRAADHVFREAMAVSGVGLLTRWSMWAAVRLFGFLALHAARLHAWRTAKPVPTEVAPRPTLDIRRKELRAAPPAQPN